MSHQSGISASEDLVKAFAEACSISSSNTDQIRLIKLQLKDEKFEVTHTESAQGTWEEDFQKIQDSVKDNQPAYIAYRLDPKEDDQGAWILICFVPETTHVRQKMLYASSKATLLKDLGAQNFQVKYYAYTQDELSLKVYLEYLEHQKASAPLTQQEQEAKYAQELESADPILSPQKRTHVSGMQVEFTEAAHAALQEFNESSLRMVILAVNLSENKVDLEETIEDSYDFTNAHYSGPFPEDQPRYALVRISDDASNSDYNMFVYWCPVSSPVRQRMIYSSYRGSVLEYIQEDVQILLKGKFELDQKDELTLERLAENLSPSESSPILNNEELGNKLNPLPPSDKPKFSRPSRRGRK